MREFESEELARIPFQSPVFVVVEYRVVDVLRRVVCDDLFLSDSWIDDDNHPPVPLVEFRKRLQDEPAWDWRV